MRTTPHQYQIDGVEAMERLDCRALLADSMGLGKTAQSLMLAHRNPEAFPLIVVCPAGLKWNWEAEVRKHLGYRVQICEGTKVMPGRLRTLANVWIVNYDILHAWTPYLRDLNPGMVVLDECHYLRNARTRRTKAVNKLCKGIPKVIAMSGTPMLKRTAELYPVLHLLRPDVFPTFHMFAADYCKRVMTPYGIRYESRNVETLNRVMSETLMVRRRKEDVMGQLPAKSRHVVTLGMGSSKRYRDGVGKYLEWEESHREKMTALEFRRQQKEHLSGLKQIVAMDKLPAALEWADNYLESDSKLILYAVHRAVVEAVKDRYKSRCVAVTGATTGSKRQAAYTAFNEDNRVRLLIGNIQAAGCGWNCTSTSTVAFLEMAWAAGDHEQCEDRVHGYKRGLDGVPAEAYYLVAGGTIDESMCRLLQRESADVRGALDGDAPGYGFDLFDRLTDELRKGLL